MAAKKKSQKKRKETKDDRSNDKQESKSQSQLGFPVIAISLLVLAISIFFMNGQQSSFDKHSNASRVDKGQDEAQCGIWVAKSTLPNAGLGMFVGRDFAANQELGIDRVVPIIDMAKHQGKGWPFLWNSYTWSAGAVASEADDVMLTLQGFGSTANAHMDLNNVNMGSTQQDPVASSSLLLDRSKDPGAGASTSYSEVMTAKEALKAGQELFMSYGDSWFIKRQKYMGIIPLLGDVHRANTLFQGWHQLQKKHGLRKQVFQDYWEKFVWNSPYSTGGSRILAALPKNWTDLDQVAESNLKSHLQHQSTSSLEWLEENGICADNFKPGMSQLPQAGRGAFATRALAKDSVIAPLPLIHVPFRQKFEMHDHIAQQQLLLNYCYGHRQSTLLLCPYGLMTSYINHSQQRPNVKIQWPSALLKSSSHHPEWLDVSVKVLWSEKQSAGLAFEMVALRNIEKGEEILLNYGAEWEAAWQKHVAAYKPPEGNYISPKLHDDAVTLKTQEEQIQSPYSPTIQIMMDDSFVRSEDWKAARWSRSRKTLLAWRQMVEGSKFIYCQILDRKNGSYKVMFSDGQKNHVADGIPREAFEFKDKSYKSDMHLPNAFRHDIRIPDEMFPEAWKNIR